MGALSELNTLLEKIPVWKRLVSLPVEVDALKERLSSLESKLNQPLSKDACPSCGERAFFIESSRPALGGMGKMGLLDRSFKCKVCGFTEQRKGISQERI